jgi:hypothetical protein
MLKRWRQRIETRLDTAKWERSSVTIAKKPVSFSAARCPQCGSIELRGPYRHNRKEIRRHRIEERNDPTLIMFMVVLGAIGAF